MFQRATARLRSLPSPCIDRICCDNRRPHRQPLGAGISSYTALIYIIIYSPRSDELLPLWTSQRGAVVNEGVGEGSMELNGR